MSMTASRNLPWTLGTIAYFSGLGLGIGGIYLGATNLDCAKVDSSCLNQRIAGIVMAVIGVIACVASTTFLCIFSACTGFCDCCSDSENRCPWNK